MSPNERDKLIKLVQEARPRIAVLLYCSMSPGLRALHPVEDVVQDVLVLAIRGIGTFEDRGEGSICRWLAQIARNLVVSMARSKGKYGGVSLDALESSDDDASRSSLRDAILAVSQHPSFDARQAEQIRLVCEALATLPETEREAILLHDYEGLDFEKAAARGGVDKSTMTKRRSRGLERIRKRLDGVTDEPG